MSDTQHIQIEIDNCLCGNTTSDEGLMTCDSNGMIACMRGDQRHVKSSSLVTFPETNADTYTLCPVCGRVYHDIDMINGNLQAFTQVNMSDPAHDRNLLDHYAEMDGE